MAANIETLAAHFGKKVTMHQGQRGFRVGCPSHGGSDPNCSILHRQSTIRKRRLGENRSFRPHFQHDAACARGKAWHGVDVQRVGGTPWKAYAGGTGVPPMRNAQMTIPFMIATGTNEMRTTAKARRVDV